MPRAFSWLRMLAALASVAPARFSVRLNLPGGSHDETGQRVGEMSVLGEMCGTASSSNHRNRINVREMVGREDGRSPSRDSFCTMDSPSQKWAKRR